MSPTLSMRVICLVGMLVSCRTSPTAPTAPTAPIAPSEAKATSTGSAERCPHRMHFTDLGPSADARYKVWICGEYTTGSGRSVPYTYAIRIGAQRTPATPTPTNLQGDVGYGLAGHIASRPQIGDEVCVVFWGQDLCMGPITAAGLAELGAGPAN